MSLRLAGSPPQSGIHCPGNCEVVMRTSQSLNSRDRDVSPGNLSRGKERGIICPSVYIYIYMRYKSFSRFPDSFFFGSNPYLIILSFSFESFPWESNLNSSIGWSKTELIHDICVITTTMECRKVLSWIFMICSFSARLPEIVDPDTITDDKIKTFR